MNQQRLQALIGRLDAVERGQTTLESLRNDIGELARIVRAVESTRSRRPENVPRLVSQAQAISELLRVAGIGSCSLPEGVRELVLQRDELLDACRHAALQYRERTWTDPAHPSSPAHVLHAALAKAEGR